MKPDSVITSLPCDAPYFIRTQQSYLKAWFYFLTTTNQPYKFYVNPSPSGLQDISMSREKVESWVDGPVKCTPEIFSLQSNFIFSRDRINEVQFNQNNFFVPFTSANEGFLSNVVVGGIPQFQYYNYLAITHSLSDLRAAFDDMLEVKRGNLTGDSEYDFEIKNHQMFLPKKVRYTNEVIKQVLLAQNRALVLVDKNHLDFLAEDWADNVLVEKNTGGTKVENLSKFYSMDEARISDSAEYIEKLVLVDYLYDNPITHYFVKFQKFPYKLNGSGSTLLLKDPEALMILWYYFYDKQLEKVKIMRQNQRMTEERSEGIA